MKKILSFLLLGMLSIGMTWANQTTLIDGVTLPDVPATALDMASQTFKTPDVSGWIVIEPNGDVRNASVTWFTALAWNTTSATVSDVSSYTAPFITLNSTSVTTVRKGERTKAIRFTGTEILSVLGSGSNNNRKLTVALFSISGDVQTLVDTKYTSTGSSFDELLFSGLTSSTEYVAYFYAEIVSGSDGNSTLAEIALKGPALAAPAITTDLPATANVAVGVAQEFSIVATGATSYQWYMCEDALKTNANAIDGATSASYEYTAPAAGTYYLYCVATNNAGSTSSAVCAATASVVATHGVTYVWGTKATELAAVAVPTQDEVAEGYNFTVASLPEAVKYKLLGWTDGVNTYAVGAAYTMGSNDVTLTAIWSELAQSNIAGETTWDWANAGSSSHQLGDATYPKNTDEFVMANLDGISNDANFNSQALLVTTQYANRGNNHYFQGNVIKFNTTVPGKVIVWFQNTSNRSDSQANRRFVYVNGINSNVYSLRQDAWVETPAMAVAAGEVIINAFTGEEAATMVRIQKIEFHPDVEITLGANGYSTYAAGNKYTVSGATVYKAEYNGSDVVNLTAIAADAVIPANAGIILKGTEGETATIAYSNDEAIEIADNDLVGVVTPIAATEGMYVLSTNAGVTAFNPCQVGLEIPANKAYIAIPSNAPSIIRIILEGQEATNINNLEGVEEAVKFMENGKLYIIRNGVVYDAMGKMVR